MNIAQALRDPQVFGNAFASASWDAWTAVLKGAFAIPMTPEEAETFHALAERDPPTKQVRELWLIAGRRAGKDSIVSAVVAYYAACCDWKRWLRPGELASMMCLAVDRQQAGIVLRYTRALFDNPLLKSTIARETQNGLELATGAEIAVFTNDYRAVRGRTVALAIMDECAFWSSDNTVSPDVETYNALLPALATLPQSMVIGLSSPYRKAGLLHAKFRQHYGRDGDVLVIRAPSSVLNPTLPERVIAEALEADPQRASAEWLAQFRDDVSGFVSPEVVEAATVPGRFELPPISTTRYAAFVDPSGGSSDAMTLAIAHKDRDRIVIDALREVRPPFSPEAVVSDFAGLLKSYHIHSVTGDRYAGEWPRERFREHGVSYEPADRTKSDYYRDFLAPLNSARVELLDHKRLATQLCQLERRTARGGQDTIDHPPGGHDDLSNVVAGVTVMLLAKAGPMRITDEMVALARQPTSRTWSWLAPRF